MRGNYGIDAPGLVLGFLAAGVALLIGGAALVLGLGDRAWAAWIGVAAIIASIYPLGMATFMLRESLVGKVRGREAILDLVAWRGDEAVLDVGCGRGLLLVGAARRLTTGGAVEVDIWQARDQSGSGRAGALANARAEGVADRVRVETADMLSLPFPDASFDVVVSAWAVHNLEAEPDRARAEMARVLRGGGTLLVDDIANREEYAAGLERLGLRDVRVVVASALRDRVLGAVSLGSFRPATVLARRAPA